MSPGQRSQITQHNNTTPNLTQRSQPRRHPWLTFDLKLTQHKRAPCETVVCLAFEPRPSFSFPFNSVRVAADGSYHPHDRAPVHLLTLAIGTLLLIVTTSNAKWQDKAAFHTSSSRRLRCGTRLHVWCAKSPRI